MQTLQSIAICPACSSTDLAWTPAKVTCIRCQAGFSREGDFVDFVEKAQLQNVESTALELWGEDLHATALAAPGHFEQVRKLFPDLWQASLRGTVLEIGFGSGTDVKNLSALHGSVSFLAFDIGANAAGLSRKLANQDNLCVFRANALRIPLANDVVDMVYSFGVFHHTRDPRRCLEEARRVLKKNGAVFFYLYSAHEDSPFKYAGVLIEKALMRSLALLPRPLREPLVALLSVPCLALFSWPARLLKACGMAAIATRFPMHWGTTPASILPDLKDRLLSPVNHRFTRRGLDKLLEQLGFREVQIRKTVSGLFGYCTK